MFARESSAEPEQLDIEEELDAQEGFDGWDVFAPSPAVDDEDKAP